MKFLDYIKGSKKGKEANQLEKDALSDPFLVDAIDGFDQFEDTEAHLERLQKITEYVDNRRIPSRKKRSGFVAAAVIAFLLIGGGYYMNVNKDLFSLSTDAHMYAYMDEVFVKEPTVQQEEVSSKEYAEMVETRSNSESDEIIIFMPDVIKQNIIEGRRHELENLPIEDRIDQLEENLELLASLPLEVDESTFFNQKVSEINIPVAEIASKVEASKDSKVLAERSISSSEVGSGYYKNSAPIVTGAIAKKEVKTEKQAEKQAEKQITSQNRAEIQNKIAKESAPSASLSFDASVMATEDVKIKSQVSNPVVGYANYRSYLKKNIRKIKSTDCKDMKGTVVLQFKVSDAGRPENIIVTKQLCPDLDKEAIRLLKEGPDWTKSDKRAVLVIDFD